MKIFTKLFLMLFVATPLLAQNELVIEPGTSEQPVFINSIIHADTLENGERNPDRVYVLRRNCTSKPKTAKECVLLLHLFRMKPALIRACSGLQVTLFWMDCTGTTSTERLINGAEMPIPDRTHELRYETALLNAMPVPLG